MNHRSEWKPNSCGMFLAVTCQHASGTCQSNTRPVLSLHEASRKCIELSPSTPPFLTLQFHEKDLMSTPNLLRIRPILPPLGHILSTQQGLLKQQKCFWYMLGWIWKKGKAHLKTLYELPQSPLYIPHLDRTQVPIQQKDNQWPRREIWCLYMSDG